MSKAKLMPIAFSLWRILKRRYLTTLAWQVQESDELTPREALGIYERNWRHIDEAALLPRERNLIDALRLALEHAVARHIWAEKTPAA